MTPPNRNRPQGGNPHHQGIWPPRVLNRVPKDAKDYWPSHTTLKEIKKAMDIGKTNKVIEIALEGWQVRLHPRNLRQRYRMDDLESLPASPTTPTK